MFDTAQKGILSRSSPTSAATPSIPGRSRSRPEMYNLIEDEFFERLSLYRDKPLCSSWYLCVIGSDAHHLQQPYWEW